MDRKELKKTIAELILREETYADQMEQTVEPYLSKRRRRCSIEREKERRFTVNVTRRIKERALL